MDRFPKHYYVKNRLVLGVGSAAVLLGAWAVHKDDAPAPVCDMSTTSEYKVEQNAGFQEIANFIGGPNATTDERDELVSFLQAAHGTELRPGTISIPQLTPCSAP